MTRGAVVKRQRRERAKVYGYVLYDETNITELICRTCKTDDDVNAVAIHDRGAIKCLRCDKVAQ